MPAGVQQLSLEHAEDGAQIDLDRLTIAAPTSDRPDWQHPLVVPSAIPHGHPTSGVRAAVRDGSLESVMQR
jgi:hypothetical protein